MDENESQGHAANQSKEKNMSENTERIAVAFTQAARKNQIMKLEIKA